MAGDIEDAEVERLADRLSDRVADTNREARIRRFLAEEVWPNVPPDELGRRLTAEEEDSILGYGLGGV